MLPHCRSPRLAEVKQQLQNPNMVKATGIEPTCLLHHVNPCNKEIRLRARAYLDRTR